MQYANYQPYPYYQNHMQSPQKKSSGLGFYILTYFLSMNIIVVGITFLLTVSTMLNMDISNFDTETLTQYIMSKLTSGPVFYYMQIFAAAASATITGLIYLKLSKTHISDCLSVKSVIGIEYSLNMNMSSRSVFENILYVVAIAVTPAFAEEFAFRGILMGSLRKYGNSFAIIVSAVMFGAMHGNIIQIPFAFILGLIFAYIDCKANSIIPSIIIHFINNLYSVIMDILQSQNIVTTRSFYKIYYSIFTAMLVFGVLAFLYIMKKDKNFLSISDTSNVVSLSLKEKIKCFFTSAGTATIVVILILETIIASVAL